MSSEPMYRAQAASAVPMRPLPAHSRSWSERHLHARVLQYRGRLVEWGIATLGFGVDKKALASVVGPVPSSQALISLGVLSPDEVDRICADQTRTQYLIEGFLPAESIAIAAGESTIGKSALICQLGLCVAAGFPFLGMPAERGAVLYFDLENSILDCKTMRDSLVRHLGLNETPQDFLLVQNPLQTLDGLLNAVRPKLVVIDSLRAFRPEVSEKNSAAGEWLKEIRKLSREYGCAFLIVHHLRKSNRESPAPSLDSVNVATWLLEMEGARALMNQTDVRIAVAEPDVASAALQMKWSRRVHGDSPIVSVERVFDEDGEPVGYRELTGAGLLSEEKRRVFEALPEEFSTADAKTARQAANLGDGNDPTNKFLAECRHLRLVEKLGRGRWRKLDA
jgi:AAA domain